MFLFRSSCFLDWVLVLSLDLPHWIRRVVTVDQFTTAMASIQEASASPRQEIDSQQSRQFVVQDETPCDSRPHLPPPLGSIVPRAPPYMLHGPFEVASPALRLFDGSSTWDDLDSIPVANLPAKFRMPDMERYIVVGCLYTYLRLYSTVMRAHGLDESQMITMFPLSLSEASRRELEGLRQRSDEFISSFISHRQGKIAEILTPEGAAWLMDLDGNRFSEPTNVDQLKSNPSRPSFLSFLLPYHPSLRYVPCLKTTLRPWDQMSSLTASTWTVVFGLPGSHGYDLYLVEPPRSFQLGPHFSTLGCHHASPSGRYILDIWARFNDFMTFVLQTCRAPDAILGHIFHFGCDLWIFTYVACSMIDDFMSPDFRPIIHRCHTRAYFRSIEIFRSSWSCMLIPICEASPLVYMIIHGYGIHARSMFDFILSEFSEEPLDRVILGYISNHCASHWCYSRVIGDGSISITRLRCIVFASSTIIPELFIDMSSQRSVVRDSSFSLLDPLLDLCESSYWGIPPLFGFTVSHADFMVVGPICRSL
ncbi:hypothetical protein AAG906_003098 [Vitis piasezkii]